MATAKNQAYLYAKLIAALRDGMSRNDLVEYTGLSYTAMLGYVQALRSFGMIYIVRWELDSRFCWNIEILKLCAHRPLPDAPRPAPASRLEKLEKQKLRDKLRRMGKRRKVAMSSVFNQGMQ